ncbi:MAG: hypothetical protein IJT71_00295, partial [Oscillospiraceae bacterium]|nr:hypothetical protein [Oscillospiraceae bacterium]
MEKRRESAAFLSPARKAPTILDCGRLPDQIRSELGAMMRALVYAACGTSFTFLMTTLGAATVFLLGRGNNSQAAMLGFAGGVMTAASVWSLLLPAIEQAAEGPLPAWLPAAVGVAVGAVFLALLDALLPRLRRQ